MKRPYVVFLCWIFACGFSLSARAAPQIFDGALEEVDFRAPEFPHASEAYRIEIPASPSPAGGLAPARSASAGASAPPAAAAPNSLDSNGITWINSPPLTMRELRGKVVLIDFWEYTCINCIRTFPATKRWYARYHRYGFEVIGVHDPEFPIAYSVSNVRAAVKRFGLPWPVVVDDKFEIWNSYHSNAWPNRFLIDAKGIVRFHRAGEGGDSAFEHAIQMLLQQAHPSLKFPASYVIPPETDAFAAVCRLPTSEMYVGDWGGRGILENSEGYHDRKTIDYKGSDSVQDGRVVLSGRWQTFKAGMTYRGKKNSGGGKLITRYHARQLYSVLNVERGHPSRLYILQDGKDLTQGNKGKDVQFDAKGRSYIEVRKSRMYYLVQNAAFGSHTVTLIPTAPGITINSFTFGNNCQTGFPHL
ncbi:MAG: redoxin domain-containing protein [Terriglobia bacterium]